MSSLLAALKPAKQGLGGGDIISLTRMATQKTLSEPDPELNGDVVAALRKGYASPEATADALRTRLRQANPHKVWLAVELTRDVLTKAPEATRHVRARVLEEVERVASSPMNRYGSDLKGQQNAKTAAFKLVSEYAGGGLLPGGGAGGANGNGNGNGGAEGGAGAANASHPSSGARPRIAAGQGQRRRPKEGGGAEAEASAAVGPSSKKPQALRKITQADRAGAGGGGEPHSPRAAASSCASPHGGGGGGDAAGPSGSAPPAAPPRGRWARVLEAAAAGEATGRRYVHSMCDALMQYSSAVARGDERAATAADAAAGSLAREMVQFNGALERVVAQVAAGGSGGAASGSGSSSSKSLGGPEAEAVTRRCLATTDAVCAALALHSEIEFAKKARAAEKGKRGEGAAAGGALGAAGAAAGSAAAGGAAAEEGSDDDDDLDELASALEAAVVSPVAGAAATGTPQFSLPRATSNNPFDASATAPPAAPAPAAAAAAFDDAAFFAVPVARDPVAPAAPAPAPAALADFADLLK